MKRDTHVQIYGQRFTLRGELDPTYLQELAGLVDTKMRLLAEQTHTLDTRRLAILAALNLADELLQCQETSQRAPAALAPEFTRRLEACNRQLGAALTASDG